jgi:hypothetical protein
MSRLNNRNDMRKRARPALKRTDPIVKARMTRMAKPEMVALAMAPTIAQGTAVAAFVASSDIETAESKLPMGTEWLREDDTGDQQKLTNGPDRGQE